MTVKVCARLLYDWAEIISLLIRLARAFLRECIESARMAVLRMGMVIPAVGMSILTVGMEVLRLGMEVPTVGM